MVNRNLRVGMATGDNPSQSPQGEGTYAPASHLGSRGVPLEVGFCIGSKCLRVRLRSLVIWFASLALGAALAWLSLSWVFSLQLKEARRAFDSGRYADAARLAEARLRSQPSDQAAKLVAARSYAHLELWAEAEAYFAQVPLKELDDFHLRLRGLEMRRLGPDAGQLCQQILQHWPL